MGKFIYSIESIREAQPPSDIEISVRSKFYYRVVRGASDSSCCYLADSADQKSDRLTLPDSVGELVIESDETFGMIVGGEYAYFGMHVELKGYYTPREGVDIKPVNSLVLTSDDGLSQEFVFQKEVRQKREE